MESTQSRNNNTNRNAHITEPNVVCHWEESARRRKTAEAGFGELLRFQFPPTFFHVLG